MSDLIEVARAYTAAGLLVLPCKPDQKHPGFVNFGNTTRSWQSFVKPLSEDEIAIAFKSRDRIAVICGSKSGNLECLDFDKGGLQFEEWAGLVHKYAPGLIDRLVMERTPSGGYHAYYRCEVVEGRLRPSMTEAKEVMIETRGEGFLSVCAPTPGYVLTNGNLTNIPQISIEERDCLLSCARSLTQYHEQPKPIPVFEPQTPKGDRPGDQFNAQGDIIPILEAHGWQRLGQHGDNVHFCRPGKRNETKATYHIQKRTFYCFTSNGAPFNPDIGYSPFDVFTQLEHGGDWKAAAKALGASGWGKQRPSPTVPNRPQPPGVTPIEHAENPPEEQTIDAPTLGYLLDNFAALVPPERVTTGYQVLDKLLNGGYVRGGMYPIAALTSKGKSTFAVNIARRMAQSGLSVILTTLEDTREQVVRKLVAQQSKTSYTAVEQHYIACVDNSRGCWREDIARTHDELHALPIKIEGEKNLIDDQENLVRVLAAKGFSVFILDQSSWVEIPGADDEKTKADACARRLKTLARKLNIIVIPLVQVNRSGGATVREGGEIELHHIKDSSHWEHDSDGVLIIQSLDNTQTPSPIRVDCKKNRHGKRDIGVLMTAHLECGLIEENPTFPDYMELAELRAGIPPLPKPEKPKKEKMPEMELDEFIEQVGTVVPRTMDMILHDTTKIHKQTARHAKYLFDLACDRGRLFEHKGARNSCKYSTVRPD